MEILVRAVLDFKQYTKTGFLVKLYHVISALLCVIIQNKQGIVYMTHAKTLERLIIHTENMFIKEQQWAGISR